MTDRDFPFVQKRFFEEYIAWTAIERVALGTLLVEAPQPLLVAAATPIRKEKACSHTPHTIRTVPQPLTDAQIQDRREILRQQTSAIMHRSGRLGIEQFHQDKG